MDPAAKNQPAPCRDLLVELERALRGKAGNLVISPPDGRGLWEITYETDEPVARYWVGVRLHRALAAALADAEHWDTPVSLAEIARSKSPSQEAS